MDLIHYRDLVGVCYTEDEAKELASNIEVTGARRCACLACPACLASLCASWPSWPAGPQLPVRHLGTARLLASVHRGPLPGVAQRCMLAHGFCQPFAGLA